jgi:hypothetical protein
VLAPLDLPGDVLQDRHIPLDAKPFHVNDRLGSCHPLFLPEAESLCGREVYEAKRIRSHYLPLLTGRLPGLYTPLRYNAEPYSILSKLRLCAFAE